MNSSILFTKQIHSSFSVMSKRCSHSHLRLSRMFQLSGAIESSSNLKNNKSISSQLMLSNYLLQPGSTSGTFSLMPLATRALEKLYRLIDEEMQAIGAQKVALPCISKDEPWKKSGRWEGIGDELMKIDVGSEKAKHCLSPTHEEAITSTVAAVSPVSYKMLPIQLYQIGRKFRGERRPKNGLLRTKEFEMKDLYTFDEDLSKAQETYEKVNAAYGKIFRRLQLPVVKVEGDVGAMGGKLSHEYHLLAEAGEDSILIRDDGTAINSELQDASGLNDSTLKKSSGIEVAHAFLLGQRYSSQFKATYYDKSKKAHVLEMGCYGIGVTRLLAAALEVLSTDSCIRWPSLIAPYQICIIPAEKRTLGSDQLFGLAESIQEGLSSIPALRNEVILDDRINQSIGKRLANAERLGFPYAIIVGKKAFDLDSQLEVVDLFNGKDSHTKYLSPVDTISRMSQIHTISVSC